MAEELKIYMIDIENLTELEENEFKINNCEDFLWISISERQNLVYTLGEFVRDYNNDVINHVSSYIRIL